MYAFGHIHILGKATGEQHRQQRPQLKGLARQFFTAHVRQTHRSSSMPAIARHLREPSALQRHFRLDGFVAQFVEHIDYQHTHDVVVFDYQKVHGADPVSRNGFLLCARGGKKFPSLTACAIRWNDWRTAPSILAKCPARPPKLVRLAYSRSVWRR
jgi:hypothetical protein